MRFNMQSIQLLRASVNRVKASFSGESSVVLLFAAYLLAGFLVLDAYGTHWDQERNTEYGRAAYEHVFEGRLSGLVLDSEHARIHGPVFEVLAVAVGRVLGVADDGGLARISHVLTFLLFYCGVVAFYLLCRRQYGGWAAGLSGCLMLVLSPRVFAGSFYNSVDISCLALFTVSAYTMMRFLDDFRVSHAIQHGLACALLTDVRNFGVLVPALTVLFAAVELARRRTRGGGVREVLYPLIAFAACYALFTVLLWPYLWDDPLGNLLGSFTYAVKPLFTPLSTTYLGDSIAPNDVPWHYTPVWMLATIPPLYTLLFLAGLAFILKSVMERPWYFGPDRRNEVFFVIWLILPLVAVVLTGTPLWGGWRHHFFIYPAFVAISTGGLVGLTRLFGSLRHPAAGRALNIVLLAAVLLTFMSVAGYILANHPHEELYFTILTPSATPVRGFGLGPQGAFYYEGLGYILRSDPGADLAVSAYCPGDGYLLGENMGLLPPQEGKRIRAVSYAPPKITPDYLLSSCTSGPEAIHGYSEVYDISAGEETVLTVYRRGV